MSRFTKPFSTILAVMLISVLAMGQSFQADDSPSLQKMQEQLTQDIQPGVVPVTLSESDFDYKKIVTSNKEKEVLWDNGGLITIPGGGSGGSDYSELQDASLGMSTYGAGFQVANNNSVADDFTVDGSWTIESFTFYGYQTGSGPPSTLNDVRFQIWDDSPMAGGTVIFGDMTTNVMLSTTWTNIWRVLESAPAENRPIMEIVADASGLVLSAGTYWVQWQVGGTGTSGPWAPPVTIVGEPTTGNALQNTSTGWAAFVDGGTLTPNGFPFIINGSTGPQAENDLGITQIISPVSGFDLGIEPVTVKITNFGTNDQSGFDVSFTLDGGTMVTETVSVTVMANDTYDYTFAATADLSDYGDYMIEACTMLASDEDLSNDCLSETVTNSDPNPPGECEDFDALNPGDYVAGELGGLWTTWSGQPGTAEDATVSDMYSVSPSNSILVEGTTDLLQLFNATTITSGVYSYSNNIYVPTGTTGYWNLQKDVTPGITEGWGIQMMYDDDGMIHIDAGADDAAVVAFSYDTWYFNEVIVDLDNDLCEFYIDGNLITQHQWTLGTFGNVGPNTLGGCNYYANPGTGGAAPGAHFDDICFTGDIPEPPAPPTNLTGPDMVSAGNDIVLNWWAPGSGSGEDFFEGFEGGTLPTGWLAIDNDGDGFNWINTIEQGFGFDAYEGTGCMTSASYDNTAGPLTPDNYLITPAIQIGATSELSYFHDAQDPAYADDFYYVKLSTTGTALSDFRSFVVRYYSR
ncbi:MAG: choice-of-anchor J domain-containing protein [Bacteroidales bacterium]